MQGFGQGGTRLSARFNKGVTEKSTRSLFWLSQSLPIACGSFIANFEPALKSRIFGNAILKNFTVLYHVKFWWPNDAQWTLDFWYVVCNKHFNKPAKNQTLSRNLWPKNALADSLGGTLIGHFGTGRSTFLQTYGPIHSELKTGLRNWYKYERERWSSAWVEFTLFTFKSISSSFFNLTGTSGSFLFNSSLNKIPKVGPSKDNNLS